MVFDPSTARDRYFSTADGPVDVLRTYQTVALDASVWAGSEPSVPGSSLLETQQIEDREIGNRE